MKNVQLVIIDGQVDFCSPNGALYVKGADEDVRRVGAMIKRLRKVWDDIHTTYDSHNYVHVAHACYWKDKKGRHPDPFTILEAKEVAGKWVVATGDREFFTTRPSLQQRGIDYCKSLAAHGRYPLCIWPPHCLIGTPGWCLMPELMTPLLEWESDFNKVEKITKGSNLHVEHYSAVQADVPDPEDPSTLMNMSFINALLEADIVALTGWASSHCLANTVRDVVSTFNDAAVGKLVLLTDGTSPVGGFEALATDFIKEMTVDRVKAGKTPMGVSTCKEFLS